MSKGMSGFRVVVGDGRTEIVLEASNFGPDVLVSIYNQNAHIGAVAIGEYDSQHKRASVSLHTIVGHKDDVVAQSAAYALSRSTGGPTCVIVGIHLDDITPDEIDKIAANTETAVERLIARLREQGQETPL